MNQAFMKVLVSEMVRFMTIPFRIMPIRKKRILFSGLTGGNNYDYSCNPKYLYEYMKEHFPGQYEYVWAVGDKERYAFLEEEGVKLVKHFTISSFPALLTSKVIVTNGSYAPWFPFRKKQYVINTWHGGGAYKKVENEKPDADWATRKRAEFCAENIDLFVASCRVQEENMIRKTYLYQGDVLRAGTPRNDKLVRGEIEEAGKKVRRYYNIPESGRIVLYAPTYRTPGKPVSMDSEALIVALEGLKAEQFREICGVKLMKDSQGENGKQKWYFMSRFHRYQENSAICVQGDEVIDVCDYPDMQELLCAADILITDYSSCVWDYAFLERPCFLFVPDKEEYTANTGFYVSVDEWPFEQAETMEEMVKQIEKYDNRIAGQRVKKHLDCLGSYEHGRCCELLGEKIAEQCV
ncbi:MAG: CDP-glycerol glycerophosphotransferase family protein [Lachnospiraceae bacterium]|nr:CDP-glycerol glycerophosphotransferase family protein [Lachnospiraceae bacterium]